MKFFITLLFLYLPITAHADLLRDLGTFSNVNKSEVWKDQIGGYATGGSIYTRTPSSNLELLTIDPPSFDAGCGGINLHFGGFGYINTQQLGALFKNIGSNAASYATMLTIRSISPQVSDLLESLESMARFMNSQNINSCQMGASIAAGLFPKNEHTQRLACQTRKMGSGGLGDKLSGYFVAREKCGDAGHMHEANAKEESLLPSEYNLVWYAFEKEGINLNKKDKELLMSISGSIIARSNGKSISTSHLPSLIKKEKLLNTLVFGNDNALIRIYSCDGNCLHPKVVKRSDKSSILDKVKEIISSLEAKVLEENQGGEVSLSEAEKDLLSKSTVPILKLISLNAGLKGHGLTQMIEDYAESVAFDYVIGYLDNLLDFVYRAIGNLEHSQIESENIKLFKEEIRSVKQELFQERVSAMNRLNTILSVKQRTRQIESQVFAVFADYRGFK